MLIQENLILELQVRSKIINIIVCSNILYCTKDDNSVYYIHLEITGDPCNLIGFQQCDLFMNCTIFCSN